MKAILVATDFSRNATHAVDYAAEMAYVMKTKLILFNACQVPVIATEIPVEIETISDLQKRGLEKLSEITSSLQLRYQSKLKIECVCKCGFAPDEIIRFVKAGKTDLVVMGAQGTDYMGEKLFGSTTTAMITKSHCPVLVVNDTLKFHPIKKIVLACDLENDPLHLPKPLLELARFFAAHIFVLEIVPPSVTVPSQPEEINDFSEFTKKFQEVSHSFHYWKNEHVATGINDFVAEKKIDLVVMMPHNRSFFSRLFHPSNTKRMAFHSTVPLLVLHESEHNTK